MDYNRAAKLGKGRLVAWARAAQTILQSPLAFTTMNA